MFKRLHLRIGYRLSLSFAAVLGLLLILAWLTLDRLENLSDAFHHLASGQLETVALTAEVGSQADVSARKLLLLISAPREQRVPAYAEIKAAHGRLDATMALLEARLPAGNRQLAYQELEARLIEYRRAYRDTVDLIEAGDIDGARHAMAEDTEDALALLARARDKLSLGEQQIARDQAHALQARLQRDRQLVLALCLTTLAAGTLFAGAVTRSIVRPLGRAEAAARRFANGEYDGRVVVSTFDEVGRVSEALNSLAAAVSEREAKILRLANTDALTGLAQRSRFVVEAGQMLIAGRDGGCAALMCFDIDRLKTINAILGFDAGDAVIGDAAERLVAVLGTNAQVARLAGGTFAALVPVPSAEAARALALAVQTEVEHQVRWDGQALDLSITTGMALYPQHAESVEPLLRQAEQAMFEAKRLRAGFAPYVPSLEASRQSHLSLLSDLHDAIQHGQLRQFLQPKLTPDGELRGAEALVRWCHPQRGWVSPAEFVPFAERTGRIRQITDWMLDQAVTTLARWQREGIELKIAVNVSTHDIQDTTLPQRIDRLLAERGVDPSGLMVELTESGLMDSGQNPINVLHSLRAIGVRLAIDDFGTGHSSLAYLQQLPVNELKIDRSFVRDVNTDPRRRELLGSIVRLGHSLGLTVTAEGAETESELAVLADVDCDLVQGFYFAKPMDVASFEAWRDARLMEREREGDKPPPLADDMRSPAGATLVNLPLKRLQLDSAS